MLVSGAGPAGLMYDPLPTPHDMDMRHGSSDARTGCLDLSGLAECCGCAVARHAVTAYASGASVAVFERRSDNYSRDVWFDLTSAKQVRKPNPTVHKVSAAEC